MKKIEARITEVLSGKFKVTPSAIDPGATFANLNFDSLATIQLALGLEEEFGVIIEDGELSSLMTVGDAAALIADLIAAGKAAAGKAAAGKAAT
jgi:acyl carrier protein